MTSLVGELILIRERSASDDALERELRALGAPVRSIDFDAATLDELALGEPALVVLDVPRGSAAILDLTPRINSRFGAIAPAVLAVIDADDGELIERAFAQGAKDVLQRPVSGPLLRAKVQRNARRAEPASYAIGGYTIERVLGRGGMGTVYLAERDGQRFALKVLDAGAVGDMESLARFRREMESLRSLRGPGIPRFYEAGRTGDAFFYVMEYVEGDTLAQALAVAPLREEALRVVIIDIARALRAIHAAALVHRDVKPGNIIMTRPGRAMLIDFGLAKFAGDLSLTRHDEVLGTILYMSPEILSGREPGPASDAFALGMTALHAALGFDPLNGTAAHIARRIMSGDLPRAAERLRGLSTELTGVIDGFLASDPATRLSLTDALRRLAPGEDDLGLDPAAAGSEPSLVLALTFMDGESAGRRVEFRPPKRIVLGRAKDSDVEVFDERVSRRHCTITLEAGGAHAKDLGSANGSFLNGAPLKLGELTDGDILRVADTQIRIELNDRTREISLTAARRVEPVPDSSSDLYIPGFELVRRIGAGASGLVFEARSKKTGETYALKLNRPTSEPTVDERKAFLRQAALACSLVHPNIVRIFERGEFAGTFYLVMELVNGETLSAYIERTGPLPVSFALHVTRQLASALELARTCGVVHGDVKPANVLLQEDGSAKLADFGVVKPPPLNGVSAYMPPEQIRVAASADHRADIYALGATLYHMLAGAPPFAGAPTPTAFLARIFDDEPVPIARVRRDVPPVVGNLLARCLKKKPDERPKSAADIVRLTTQLLSSVEKRDTVSDT